MTHIHLKRQNVIEYVWAIIGTLVAIFICLPISKDRDAYHALFQDLPLDSSMMEFSFTSEFFFWGWMQWVKSVEGTLAIGLVPIIFIGLLFKLKAFKYFSNNNFYTYLSYACIFYFLLEGTQLRISVALGFSLFACVAIAKHNLKRALFFSIMGFGFHITSFLLPLLYFVCYQSIKAQKMAWGFLLTGILAFLAKISVINIVLLPIINMLGGRYLDYVSDSRLENQNSTGLMFVYASALSAVLVFLYYWSKTNPKLQTHLFNTSLAVSVYGAGLLFWLYSMVSLASRLSDILTIMLIPLLGYSIGSSQNFFRFLSIAGLLLFALMRMQVLYGVLY